MRTPFISTWRPALADSKKTPTTETSPESLEAAATGAAAAISNSEYGPEHLQALKGLEGIRHVHR